jgi:hypothetical protein
MADEFNPEIMTQDITRQRDLAKMLLQQGMQNNMQGQMIGNRYVGASPLQGVANLANIWVGKNMAEESDRKQAELADLLRTQGEKDIQAYAQAVTPRAGVEAQPEFIPQGQTAVDDQGMPTYGYKPAVEAVPEKKANFAQGLSILRNSKDPETRALGRALMADMFKTQKLGEGESLVRGNFEGGFTPVAGEGGIKKTPDIKNYEYDKANGFKGSFNDWLMAGKRASGTNLSFNTGKDLAGQVGDISKESRISAMGAVQTADAANRIIQAVDTNKLFQGAGANQRLTAAQIADGLGLGGKETKDKIANSRQAIKGLAELTLQGRKQMRGEGAITESEGALAEKAMSGDISLTGPEIRQLAESAKRSAKFQYGQHQQIINTMKADPNTKGLVPYYDIPADTSIFAPRAVGAQSDVRNKADQIIGGQ